jgi:transglutaminase-like putative cysteine protease
LNLIETVRRANQVRRPEHSVPLRLATAVTVAVAMAAPASEGEMPWGVAFVSMALMAAGMAFSYRTRVRPPGWVKLGVAAGAVSSLAWFVSQAGRGPITDITAVEDPLTVMFAWILIVHSFHVPARKDLAFALGGSAGLMAVAAAQAVDMRFGVLVAAWTVALLWALTEMWVSTSTNRPARRFGPGAVGGAAVIVAAAAAFLVLPAPIVALRVGFPTAAGPGGGIPAPGALAGDSGGVVQLSRPGSPAGRTRVGGYLGFAGSLDTAVRGHLSNQLVMQVRADRPGYFVGETFDEWTGQSWSSTLGSGQPLLGGSPFVLDPPPDTIDTFAPMADDLQTFYIADATADLVFHAGTARQVWFPATKLYVVNDGTLISPIGIGKGAVYTVEADLTDPDPALLRAVGPAPEGAAQWGMASSEYGRYTQLPHPYPQAAALAVSQTAGAPNEYDAVQGLISWIGSHTRYSTDIPPLAPGADSVNEFLFGNRTGYCEQISTALAVMLRSLGIPARETVGYVPGAYNPVTGLYQVRADDAHAWVEVWFPGYGWQSFDPTAAVPLANPSPGGTALGDAGRFLGALPWAVIGSAAGALVLLAAALVLWRRRPRTRMEVAVRRMRKAGRRAGRPWRPDETVLEYGTALGGGWDEVAAAVDAAAFGGDAPSDEEWGRLLAGLGSDRAVK